MRSFIISLGLFFVLCAPAAAVGMTPPVVFAAPTDTEAAAPRKSRYERQTESYYAAWNRLIPRYSKVQFAGGMGLVSVGIGWDYGRKKQWETDLFLGYLPRFSGDKASATFTLKQNYIPWRLSMGGRWSIEPLTTGLYVNKLTSRNFWGREPEKYGNSYYKFSTNTRFSLFLGQRLTLAMSERFPNRSVSVFYEFSTCDLYLISAVSNHKTIHINDIVVLSLGLKFQFL